jgi:hypothetical protein
MNPNPQPNMNDKRNAPAQAKICRQFPDRACAAIKKNRMPNIDFMIPVRRTPMALKLFAQIARAGYAKSHPWLTETWDPACHAAARAAMRRALGMGPTEIRAPGTGTGCLGGGETVRPRDRLLVLLAGLAWEAPAGSRKLDFLTMKPDAFNEAREFLAKNPALRLRNPRAARRHRTDDAKPRSKQYHTVQAALEKHFTKACKLLEPYGGVIEVIGKQLQEDGTMSARRLSALLGRRGRVPAYSYSY